MFFRLLEGSFWQVQREVNRYALAVLAATVFVSILTSAQFAPATHGSSSSTPHLDLTPQPSASASSPTWSVQEMLTGGSFGAIYMVLDSNNNPHIVHPGANGLLYYTVWNGADWKTESIIQGGTPYALILDSSGKPHVLFKGANDITYYASLRGKTWSYQVAPTGNRYSLALDKQGNPHMVYGTQLLVRDYPPGVTNNFYALNYASWNGTGWNAQVVQEQISSSDTISLALDSNDNPRIMYGNDTYYPPSGGYTLTVKIATRTGSKWSIQTGPSDLDNIGNMVLDSQDKPHFAYERNYPHESIGNVSLGYASWNGATWSMQTVASHLYLPGLILQSSLALDSHDNPHIEFFNGSLIYASWTGSNWNLETVAPDQFAYGAGPLALDSHDSPNICYWVDDIHNTTAFVSMLIITTPTPKYRTEPLPRPTESPPPSPPASVSSLWKYNSNWSMVNSPVLSDGSLYVTSGSSGGGSQELYCINLSTGTELWSLSGLFGTLTVAEGRVFVGESTFTPSFSLLGTFLSLNASTGVQLWNYSGGTSFTNPVVNEGIVYVSGFSYTLSTDFNVGSIYAFNTSTGKILCEFTGPPGTRFDYEPNILQAGNIYGLSAAYLSQDASWRSGIYAFNAQTGREVWNYTAAGQFGSLLVSDQIVFVSSNHVDTRNYLDAESGGGYVYQGGILALNSLSGKPMWSFPIESSVGTPLVSNNTVYVVSGEGVIYALNAADGNAVWSYTAGTGLGPLLVVDDYIYAGSSSGVYCLNVKYGPVIWIFAASNFASSSTTVPAYADGIIYVGWNGPMYFSSVTRHNFYGLSASNGTILWNYEIGYTVSSQPVVEEGLVYISGNFVTGESPDFPGNGAVIALKPSITSLPLLPPSATPSMTASSIPSLTASPTPSPTVPELPTWAILPLIIISAFTVAVTFGRKKKETASKQKGVAA